MNIYKKGDRVQTRHGNGIIEHIDRQTYSIPMNTIKLTSGRHKGERIALTNGEIHKQQERAHHEQKGIKTNEIQ